MNVSSKSIARIMEIQILAGEDPKVTDIANVIGWTRSNWDKQFTREMNATPGYYMRLFRIRCICADLRNKPNSYTIENIAADYLRTQPFLTRDFKRIVGVTPGSYRGLSDTDATKMREIAFNGINFTHSFNTIPPTPKELF